jgi:hypothetical protein
MGYRAMYSASYDAQLRQAAFSEVDRLDTLRGGGADSGDLAGRFEFRSGGTALGFLNDRATPRRSTEIR